MRLVFQPDRPITDVAFEAGYQNSESFTRAFQRQVGQSPSEFRRVPAWAKWRALFSFPSSAEPVSMNVEIIPFPETRVAAIEHSGSTANVYESTRKLVEWRIRNRVPPETSRTYGVHYDMRTHAESGYRLDLCVSFDREVKPNSQGVVAKVIPAGRCARRALQRLARIHPSRRAALQRMAPEQRRAPARLPHLLPLRQRRPRHSRTRTDHGYLPAAALTCARLSRPLARPGEPVTCSAFTARRSWRALTRTTVSAG